MPLSRLCFRSVPLAALPLLASACPGFTPSPFGHATNGASEDAADGDSEATADAPADAKAEAAPPPSCNLALDPTSAPCLTTQNGLFVSPPGSDTSGDGSPAHPFATVGHALHSSPPGSRIYICAGQYTEHVALASGAAANLYGGFSCPGSGGEPDAIAATLDAATCIAHDVNPRAYLHKVVHCIVHGWPQVKLRDLLPDRMLASHPELYFGDPDALPLPPSVSAGALAHRAVSPTSSATVP